MWVHKPGQHNQVADALSRKEVAGYVGSLSRVMAEFTERIRREAPQDSAYERLVEQVKEGITRPNWLDELLYFTEVSSMFLQAN